MTETDSPEVPANPWPALTRIAEGDVPGQELRFRTDVATRIANHISAIMGRLATLLNTTEDIPRLAPIPGTTASGPLFAELDKQAWETNQILGKHIDILRDMRATFIAAGKAYIETEDANRSEFDKLHPGAFDKIPNSGTHLPEITMPPIKDDGLKKQSTTGPSPAWWVGKGTIDNPYSKQWGWLYHLGKNIRDSTNIQLATYGATKWHEMATQLVTIYSDLAKDLKSTADPDNWKGVARDAAIEAVESYIQATVPALHGAMTQMGHNMKFVGGWLDSTQKSMPQTEQNPATTSFSKYAGTTNIIDDETRRYQNNMQLTYVTGVGDTYQYIPEMPQPNKSFPGGLPIPTKTTTDPPTRKTLDDPTVKKTTGTTDTPTVGPTGTPTEKRQDPKPDPRRDPQIDKLLGPQPDPRQDPLAPPDQRRYQDQLIDGGQPRSAVTNEFGPEQRDNPIGPQPQPDSRQPVPQPGIPPITPEQQTRPAAAQSGQPGTQALQQAMQAAEQAAQQARQNELRAGMPPAAALPGTGVDPKTGLPRAGGGPGPGPGVGAPGRDAAQGSKLFPRASLPPGAAANAAGGLGRAGTAPMGGMPGSPGAAGAAGRGAGGDANSHKRPTYLDSTRPLEEAMGEAPRVVDPVIER